MTDAQMRAHLTPAELQELDELLAVGTDTKFVPNPGPQQMVLESKADIIGFGGAAGGGKSMLITGLATEHHTRSLIVRQQKVQTRKFVQEIAKLQGTRDGYSSQTSSYTIGERLIEFGGLENEGDEEKWQGHDHDLKAFDEATQMREGQVRYVAGWNRTDDPLQVCRTVLTFNPPTTAEGRWVIKYFGPWLDPKHPNPARDGELRWFTTIGDNKDYEVRGPEPFVIVGGKPVYDFNPADHAPEEIVRAKSRTFIRSRVTDNPYYMKTGYISQLQQLPEPLRSQMLNGDFGAGVEDAAMQVIPTAWIEAAMDRWRPRDNKEPMDSMGVDAARGGNNGSMLGAVGKDKMIISRRHGRWFDHLIEAEGVDVNTGNLAAAMVLQYRTDLAPIHLDIVGIGTSPYDVLDSMGQHVIAINGAAASSGQDKSSLLKFYNKRAEVYWRLREALDPTNPDPIALPDDADLLADLAAPTWSLRKDKILLESKDDIQKRLSRSPDKGDAVAYALLDTPKREVVVGGLQTQVVVDRFNDRYKELRGN